MSAPRSEPDPQPLLAGARARSGMAALVERLKRQGVGARVFGHPACLPANRDALAAAGVGAALALGVWPFPAAALWAGGLGLAVAALAAGGVALWPRREAWTVLVGAPSRAVRELHVLALDVRRAGRWRVGVAALPAVAALLFPGGPWPALVGLVAVGVCAADFARARPVSLDAAAAWAAERVAGPERLVLVTTAGSAHGEGVRAVVDWFHLDAAALAVALDEDGDSGVAARLAQAGIGTAAPAPTRGGDDVVVGGRARG